MSKSKNNGVDPQLLIDQYGADTARLFTMFAAPPEQQLEWSGAGVEGASRFLRRVWGFGYANAEVLRAQTALDAAQLAETDKVLRREIHGVLKQADFDYQRLQYNTVVSAAMKMLNALEGAKGAQPAVLRETFGVLLRVLYPVVPHVTYRLWQELGYAAEFGTLLDASWPKVDEKALEQAEIELVLQVNGKVRGALTVAKDAAREAIEQAALAHEMFAKFGEGKPAKKVVIVPGRLVNIVV
jgi:leucyl-tRNA synthetase